MNSDKKSYVLVSFKSPLKQNEQRPQKGLLGGRTAWPSGLIQIRVSGILINNPGPAVHHR